MRTLLFKYKRFILLWVVLTILPGLAVSQSTRELKLIRDSLLNNISSTANDSMLAVMNYDLANVYITLNNYDKAVQAYGASALHAKQCNNLDLQVEALYNEGVNKVYLKRPGEAILDFLTARKVVEKLSENAKTPEQVDHYKSTDAKIVNNIGQLYFQNKHFDKAIDNFLMALTKYEEVGDRENIAQMLHYTAISYASKNDYDNALAYYERLLDEYRKNDDWENCKTIYQRIAQVYALKGDYQKLYDINFELYDLSTKRDNIREQSNALNNLAYSAVCLGHYEDAIRDYEQLSENLDSKYAGDEMSTDLAYASTHTNLGLCHHNLGRVDEATKHLKKAIEIYNKYSMNEEAAKVSNLLARIYYMHGEYHNAEYYQQQAEGYAIESGDSNILKQVYKNYNEILTAKQDYNGALEYYQKYLAIEQQDNDAREKESRRLASELKSLTDAERTFGEALNEQEVAALNEQRRQVEEKAKQDLKEEQDRHAQEALAAALERENLLKAKLIEEQARNEAERLAFQERQRADSLRNKQEELRREQEARDRQRADEKAEMDRKFHEQQEESERFRNIMILSIGILIFFIFFMISLRNKNKKLKEQQAEIELKNADLIMKNEEITVQKENLQAANNEILTKNEELSRQKEIIEAANKSITDSIVYAKRIQNAVSPSPRFLNMFNLQYFMFFRPRDIVSGDYYWFHADDYNHIFICAADCTGHGVPGAFMSMLGLSLFNKIVAERNIIEPDQILNNLRTEVKAALHQEDVNAKQKDGMDLSLVRLDVDTQMIHFAAANNNGYLLQHFGKDEEEKAKANLIKPEHLRETEDGYLRLTVMPADSMPIGVYIREKESFTMTSYQLRDGDSFYLTSDGYIDQFGGKWGRKFLSKNFQQLLMDINSHDMKTQEKIVIDTHDNWIGGEYEQLDDIIVIGVRV